MTRRPGLIVGRVAMTVIVTTLLAHDPAVARSDRHRPPARLETIELPAPEGEIDAKWLSYPGSAKANVLLPAGYDRHKRYPLIVFLHGLGLNYDAWAHYGLTEPFERLGAIMVMPEGGNGWYADWWNAGARGNPSWESYELETVLPAILARYSIRSGRRWHALIGISMGGLGATYLGGRLPGFFGTVATLSGFVDTQYPAIDVQPLMAVFSNAAANGDNFPDPIYGPPDGFYSTGHNPVMLTSNLKHTRVFQSTGTGAPSAAYPDPSDFENFEEAAVIYPMNESYSAALAAAGIDVTYQVHPGNHDLPDFLDEIDALLEWGLFERVVTNPASWVNQTVATSGQLWDFNYRFDQPPDQVVTFSQSGTTLSISAAGSAVTITTGTGCAIHTDTPATVRLPSRHLVSPRRPDRMGRAACR